ncbi:hypothetical protein PROFUN_11212 [Planoprotostelium fungivorum]|uniref:Uncharacterized protein n=1 Tax=Planoprotostelium fungivorum TaxID=1890364 RepID=A0A2P6NAX2_9EUKA|nr:hypothetical protein PROFUN_11212 [Planoprotostelium fungivorum]
MTDDEESTPSTEEDYSSDEESREPRSPALATQLTDYVSKSRQYISYLERKLEEKTAHNQEVVEENKKMKLHIEALEADREALITENEEAIKASEAEYMSNLKMFLVEVENLQEASEQQERELTAEKELNAKLTAKNEEATKALAQLETRMITQKKEEAAKFRRTLTFHAPPSLDGNDYNSEELIKHLFNKMESVSKLAVELQKLVSIGEEEMPMVIASMQKQLDAEKAAHENTKADLEREKGEKAKGKLKGLADRIETAMGHTLMNSHGSYEECHSASNYPTVGSAAGRGILPRSKNMTVSRAKGEFTAELMRSTQQSSPPPSPYRPTSPFSTYSAPNVSLSSPTFGLAVHSTPPASEPEISPRSHRDHVSPIAAMNSEREPLHPGPLIKSESMDSTGSLASSKANFMDALQSLVRKASISSSIDTRSSSVVSDGNLSPKMGRILSPPPDRPELSEKTLEHLSRKLGHELKVASPEAKRKDDKKKVEKKKTFKGPMFGISISDLLLHKGGSIPFGFEDEVPRVVVECIHWLESNETGDVILNPFDRAPEIDSLRKLYDKKGTVNLTERQPDAGVVMGLILHYLDRLPQPMFDHHIRQTATSIITNFATGENIKLMKNVMSSVEKNERVLLSYLLNYLENQVRDLSRHESLTHQVNRSGDLSQSQTSERRRGVLSAWASKIFKVQSAKPSEMKFLEFLMVNPSCLEISAQHRRMALKGIKVVEMAGLAPGPFCGMILSDYGADVVRVDKPNGNNFDPLARGKRSICINYRDKRGLEVLLRLVEKADVFIDPFRPGAAEHFGFGPKVLCERNPKLIYVRLTGYGQTGPLANRAGHDINYISLNGVLSGSGRKGEKPMFPLNVLGDFAGGGLMAAFGVMVALHHRNTTKKGQVIDVAMTDGVAYLNSFVTAFHGSGLWNSERGTNMLDSGAHFYEIYKTKDDKFVSVGAIEPQFYALLLKGLGLKGEDLPHQNDQSEWDNMKRRFTEIFLTKTRDEWNDIFKDTDACVAPIIGIEELNSHPHTLARNVYRDQDGKLMPRPAPVFSGEMWRQVGGGTNVGNGEHSRDIMREMGLKEEEKRELERSGVVESRKSSLSDVPMEMKEAVLRAQKDKSSSECSFRVNLDDATGYVIEAKCVSSTPKLVTVTLKGHPFNFPIRENRLYQLWEQQVWADITEVYQLSAAVLDVDEKVNDMKVISCTPRWNEVFFPGQVCRGKFIKSELGMQPDMLDVWIRDISSIRKSGGQGMMENEVILTTGESFYAENRCRYLYTLCEDGVYRRLVDQECSPTTHRFLNLAYDITEKKRYEKISNLQRQLIDTTDTIMVVVELLPEGHFKWHMINEAAKKVLYEMRALIGPIEGLNIQEGMTSKELGLHPESLSLYRRLVDKLISTGSQQCSDEIHDLGSNITYFCTACELEPSRYGLLCVDVTEMKRTKSMVEEKEAMLAAQSRFLAVMSHDRPCTDVQTEIRTPLTGIMETLNHFLEKQLHHEDIDVLMMGKGCSEQLLCVINDVLDYSKIEYGELSLEYQPVLLQGVLEESLDIIAMQANRRHLPIVSFNRFPIHTQVQTDRGRLRQIICNLLSNAIKFTEEGQVVMTGRMMDAETLEITVSDSGVGLSEEFKKRIFHPFQQSDSSITRKYGGTGLGLSICKRTCVAMGGDISAESQGKGATFRFHVRTKLTETSEEGNVLKIMVEQLCQTCRGKRIVIIDGKRAQADMLRDMLEPLGCIVETFGDGLQITPTARDCDLVIVDRECLPEGTTTLQSTFPRAIVIFSGNFAPGVERKEEEQFLWKPFKRRQIVKMLHRNLVPQNKPSRLREEKKDEDLNGLRILVAEDNVTNQKVIHRMLSKLGVRHIRVVDDGEKAVRSCRGEERYHLVLMDCNMPVKGGIDATRDIMEMRETDRPCIVGLTADVSAGNRRDCLDAGMSDILTKPVDRDHLRRVVMDAYQSLIIPAAQ